MFPIEINIFLFFKILNISTNLQLIVIYFVTEFNQCENKILMSLRDASPNAKMHTYNMITFFFLCFYRKP